MFAVSKEGSLLVAVLFGAICAALAAGRGRSAIAWFFIGLIANCFGIILLLVLPDLKVEADQQRLREQEGRMRDQLARGRPLPSTMPPPLSGAPIAALQQGAQWFYARGRERMGPVAAETILHLWHALAIDEHTLVWSQGMTDWAELGSVDAFRQSSA